MALYELLFGDVEMSVKCEQVLDSGWFATQTKVVSEVQARAFIPCGPRRSARGTFK